VQIEDVARVRLAARRTAQQQRDSRGTACACFDKSSYTQSACRPLSRKYSPIVHAEYGLM
jgi:hypothetical protein